MRPACEPTTLGHLGVSLRDYFAAQAIAAFAAYGPAGHAPADMVARASYELADAMLAVRAETPDA